MAALIQVNPSEAIARLRSGEIRRAHELLESNATFGKVVLEMPA